MNLLNNKLSKITDLSELDKDTIRLSVFEGFSFYIKEQHLVEQIRNNENIEIINFIYENVIFSNFPRDKIPIKNIDNFIEIQFDIIFTDCANKTDLTVYNQNINLFFKYNTYIKNLSFEEILNLLKSKLRNSKIKNHFIDNKKLKIVVFENIFKLFEENIKIMSFNLLSYLKAFEDFSINFYNEDFDLKKESYIKILKLILVK